MKSALRPLGQIPHLIRPSVIASTGFLLLVGMALWPLAGCGGKEPVVEAEPDARSSTPVRLELLEGTWPDMTEQVALRIDAPTEAEGPWECNQEVGSRIVPGGTVKGIDERAMTLRPIRRPFVVHVPVDIDSSEFDLVRVRLATRGFVRVGAFTGFGTKKATRSDLIERNRIMNPVSLDLDMSALSGTEGPIARVSILFEELTHQGVLLGIDLIKRPVAARLPSPEAAAVHTAVDSGSRRAVGLLPGMRMGGTVQAPLGGYLAVETSLPESAQLDATANLTMELRSEGETLQSKTVEVTRGWKTQTIGLGDAAETVSAGQNIELALITSDESGLLIGSARLLAGKRGPEAKQPRTVVFITSDTHRSDHMGAAANSVGVTTPFLDALGERGVRFEDVTSTTSITNPSHAAMFTGLSVRDTGIVGNIVLLSERAATIAEAYEAAGFRTFAAVSARHLIPWRSGFGQGFEKFDAPHQRGTRDGQVTIAAAREMLSDAKDHDVFLWLHLFDAHAPYRPHDGCTDIYYEGDPYSEKLAELAPKQMAKWDKKIRDGQYILALYKGEVTYLDGLVEGLLKDEPRLNDGWLAFTSDHGEALGEVNMFWSHAPIYPATLKVPLILTGPGIPDGRVVTAPVSNADVARTLLEASGILEEPTMEAFVDFPGRSLLRTDVMDGSFDEPRFVVSPNALAAGIFTGDWYLMLNLQRKGWGNPPGADPHTAELYNIKDDPTCKNNLAASNPGMTKRLRKSLVSWLSQAPEGGTLTGDAPVSAAARADIAELGYAVNESSSIQSVLMDANCGCEYCESFR